MFGQRLYQLRQKRGLTQKELSSRLGMARTTYSGYENGSREPDHQTLEKFADFFEVSIDFLIGRTKDKDPVETLIEFLDLELTNEEIKSQMNFKVDDITLSDEEMDEFITFVRVKRAMKKRQTAASTPEEI